MNIASNPVALSQQQSGFLATSPSQTSRLSPADEDQDSCVYTRYTGVDTFLNAVATAGLMGDCLVVRNVSIEAYQTIKNYRDSNDRKFRIRDYNSVSQVLIVIIPSGPHETADRQLTIDINTQIINMGLRDAWDERGSQSYSSGQPGVGDKQPDISGRPWPQRGGPNDWPTLVVEIGFSQSLTSLRDTMRKWFQYSNHEVKIVILIKIFGPSRRVLFERWQEQPPSRPGATTTRSVVAALSVPPNPEQTIDIRQQADGTFTSSRSDLVLPFRLLFLRDPILGTAERDIVITIPQLTYIAGRCIRCLP